MRAFSRRKVSQRALAKRLQVTEASISRYLNGTQSPSRDVVWEIEKAYGVRHGYVERIAGYVEDDNLGVTEAIFADERLNDGEKRMLAAAYASALAN